MPQNQAREAIRIAHQVQDNALPRTLAHLIKRIHRQHLIGSNGGVHAARENPGVGIEFLKNPRGFARHGVRIAAHVHEHHVVPFDLPRQLLPTGDGAGRGQVGHDAVLVHDGTQKAEAVVLPLLMRAGGVDEVAQIPQV